MEEFKKLGLSDKVIKALEKKGFQKPTLIQKMTIPLLLKGDKDVVGKAQTGTGKTACFALPIIERISQESRDIQAIILTPTRELALQVSKEIESLQGEKRFRVLAVYGGASIRDQMDELRRGVHIVVGTPGRVMDLMKRKRLNLSNVSYAVLDEADEMLNMGFVEDIETILSQTNKDKKMLLFSATMPRAILKIAKTFMKDYELVEANDKQVTGKLTKQVYFNINSRDRVEGLHRIIDVTKDFHGIIFCKTRLMVDEVTNKLIDANYAAAGLHGDISQAQREKILGLFRKRLVHILVATDVAARGIDVTDLTHVINFSLPQSPESYVHRIGRTGRAGKEGTAITFLIPSEKRKLKFIERLVGQNLIRGELPTIKEVIELKKAGLQEKLNKILTSGDTKKYDDITKKLLEENSPEKAISALLKYIFKSEIEPSKYKKVATVSGGSDRPGFRGRDRPSRGGRDRSSRDRPSRDRPSRDRPRGRSNSDRPSRDKPRRDKPSGDRSSRDRPRGDRPSRDRPRSDKPSGDRPSSAGRSRVFSGRKSSRAKQSSSEGTKVKKPRRDR
jgi:ATP-dependent RNA helicase DeaD